MSRREGRPDRRCVLVLDDASRHAATVAREYLDEMKSVLELLWRPPYCPEPTDIEWIWEYV